MNGLQTCRCEAPQLYLHKLDVDVRCFTCGAPPREDLGGLDDLARVRYRAELNRLMQDAIELPVPVQRKGGMRLFETTREQRVAAAVHLRKAEDLTYEQIGDRIGVTASTVQMYLRPEKYERQKKRSREYQLSHRRDRSRWQREYTARNRERVNAYQREYKRRRRAEARAQAVAA